MNYIIMPGDNRETLKRLDDNSIDAIVTDPPYGIDFLGKAWDANTGALETYQECLRVLKPGGHIVAFSAARTYHHLAITLEQAGFEIRDQIMWIYSSGFPKSQDVGKQLTKKNIDNAWAGWGTQLKPAHEPIALARKPIKTSIAQNCQTHGVGALNIDATRIPFEDEDDATQISDWKEKWGGNQTGGAPVFQGSTVKKKKKSDLEIYLNNIAGPMERAKIAAGTRIGMHEGKTGFKAQKGKVKRPAAGNRTASFHNATGGGETQSGGDGSGEWTHNEAGRFPSNVIGEIPLYQKYFYCPKVSSRERHINGAAENIHPTVKPIELMKYLIKLITPPGGTVLDPFNGSGSTGCAAVELGHTYIGCELDPKYVEIAKQRIEAWYAHTNPTTFNQIFTQE